MFDRINIVPRWIIFTLDISCCVLALFFAYMVRYAFDINRIETAAFNRNLLIILTLNALLFFRLRMYAGIVRYTSAMDSVRILFTVLLGAFLLFLTNNLMQAFDQTPLMSNAILIIYALSSFLLLTIYRTLVKTFFLYVKNRKAGRVHVVIYGAGDVGIAAKRTFDHDHRINKVVLAFIDDNTHKAGKIIDGVRIYHTDALSKLLDFTHVDELVISTHNIPVGQKAKVVDLCLANGIKVLTLPPVYQLIDGEINPGQIQQLRIEDLLERDPICLDNAALHDQLRGKRILITGAAGSIGSEIARQLSHLAPQLIILCDQAESALHELHLELKESNRDQAYHPFIGDVCNQARMELLFRTFQPHAVYHAAAYKHVPLMEHHPAEAIRVNVMGTRNLANLAVRYRTEKFVMVSTDKAVNPTNVMGASKRIAEIYVQTYFRQLQQRAAERSTTFGGTRFITTRFGNVLGSNGSVIPRFQAQIAKGGPVTVTHPEITRYFMTIPEACQLVLEAGCLGQGGEIYVFDMGKPVKIIELAHKMIRLSGLVPNKDVAIEFSGLRPGEKLYEELLNNQENTLPTHHKKIMIARVREYDFSVVEESVNALINLVQQQRTDREIVQHMKALVPEFKSNNSVYEELDRMRRVG